MTESIKTPMPDTAEWNAFFPSPYPLSVYTAAKTDFDGVKYDSRYGGKKKVLVILSDERYLAMENGKLFSTGNHPVETLLPMMHLAAAGFSFDIATLSGRRAKFEQWAMPLGDDAVMAFYEEVLAQMEEPQRLEETLKAITEASDVPYAAVFIPGGHGVLNAIPENREVHDVLHWAFANEVFIISLCHGPASLLAANDAKGFPFAGYELCVFPDSLDEGANIAIGYMPGRLKKLVGKNLAALGVKILNSDITGKVHRDRTLLTGDSPLASNALGKLAAETLLAEVK